VPGLAAGSAAVRAAGLEGLPPGLAAGDASGHMVLRAVLAGYQAMIALGRAVGPGHYAQFHNTGTCGSIGAAAGAAVALGLTDAQAVGAMGTALSLAGGLWQCRNEAVATKHLHVAEAARRGLIAARHAQAGLPGPRLILEGPQGLFAGMARDGWPLRVLDGQAGWLVHQVSFKPWPACRHAHPAIDAALSLRDGLAGEGVARAEVATYADAVTFCDRAQPQTTGQAQFSLQHALAVCLLRGPPGLADFEPPAIADPGLAALRARVGVSADAGLTARYPAHFGARVSLTTVSGRVLTALRQDAWGDPEVPMTKAAIQAKFDALSAHAGLAPAKAAQLAQAALDLARDAPLAGLTAPLHALTLTPQGWT